MTHKKIIVRIVSNIIISFIAIAILDFFIESFLRLTSSEKTDNFANTKEFQTKYVFRNSHGYRDKEYQYQKPNNIFRILVLGDSQTFGSRIRKLENTWHKKLEVLLNQGFEEQRFKIISLAGEGLNTYTRIYKLFKKFLI